MIRHSATVFLVGLALCCIGTRSQAADVSGAWKIATLDGPTPVCSFIQSGNTLSGACIGPQASGTVTGITSGSIVRWHWQWLTYGRTSAAAFDFLGTLKSDGVMTGALERRETGYSRTFAARKISPITGSAPASGGIPLEAQDGTFVVPGLINNAITLDFMVDSGASDVSIPADVLMTLQRTGTLDDSDFIDSRTYKLADGSIEPSARFRIRTLKVGDIILENVIGSMTSARGSLLLGQSFLTRFKSWAIDNVRQTLILVE